MMNADRPPGIEIEAQIMEYMPDAMNDRFKDGRFALFDAAILAIRRPGDLDPRMIVYVPQPAAADSPWRRVGSTVVFRIAPEMLAPGTAVFEGAVHDLIVKEALDARQGEEGEDTQATSSQPGNANE
jgi:hypothetical protein